MMIIPPDAQFRCGPTWFVIDKVSFPSEGKPVVHLVACGPETASRSCGVCSSERVRKVGLWLDLAGVWRRALRCGGCFTEWQEPVHTGSSSGAEHAIAELSQDGHNLRDTGSDREPPA